MAADKSKLNIAELCSNQIQFDKAVIVKTDYNFNNACGNLKVKAVNARTAFPMQDFFDIRTLLEGKVSQAKSGIYVVQDSIGKPNVDGLQNLFEEYAVYAEVTKLGIKAFAKMGFYHTPGDERVLDHASLYVKLDRNDAVLEEIAKIVKHAEYVSFPDSASYGIREGKLVRV